MTHDIDRFGFQWHVTDNCHGRCRHCYQDRFDKASELSLDALRKIADHIFTFFRDVPVCVNLTGGEPLLYGGVFELMAHISSYPNLNELNIITSTRGQDAAAIDKLRSIPKLSSIKVSLESHDPRINDDIRGDGHFDMVTGNIRALSQVGLSTVIMTTLGGHNYRGVKEICEYAAATGARGIILERHVPLGSGANLPALSPREWREVADAVVGVGAIDIPADDLLPYRAFRIDMPHGALGDDCGVSGAACDLGPSSMALMPDGTVYPCRRCPVPVGNLSSGGMESVMPALGEYAKQLQRCCP